MPIRPACPLWLVRRASVTPSVLGVLFTLDTAILLAAGCAPTLTELFGSAAARGVSIGRSTDKLRGRAGRR